MEYPSVIIKELVEQLVKLPGIGKRTALRMVLSMLKFPEEDTVRLGELISSVKTKIKHCKKCHTICDDEICNICNDNSRDHESVCIVQEHRDLLAIENTGQYRGVYHVLGGLINPLEGIGPSELNITSLLKRLESENIKEVIFALNATMEGDTTIYYISKELKSSGIKTSVISRGISIGTDLEFADEITLGRSIANRTVYNI